jgi:hypothetical protein
MMSQGAPDHFPGPGTPRPRKGSGGRGEGLESDPVADSPEVPTSSSKPPEVVVPGGEPGHTSLPKQLTTGTVDRRIAVAGAVLGFGIGLALGLKLASGMPKAIEVPVPSRVPCRNCQDRERRAQAAAAQAKANGAPVIPVESDDPLPDEPRPVVFSPLAGAPADMVAAAHVPTDANLPPDQTE